uniref:Uncharacterized protein n=1 Tax=Daphnia magna TaxID=35525 RepID=A0A0P4Y0V5_9CRUS
MTYPCRRRTKKELASCCQKHLARHHLLNVYLYGFLFAKVSRPFKDKKKPTSCLRPSSSSSTEKSTTTEKAKTPPRGFRGAKKIIPSAK